MAPVPLDEGPKEGALSLELIIAIASGAALFIAIVLGFCLVARKECSVRPCASDHKHVHAYTPPRGSPIASVDRSKCPRCLGDRRRAHQVGSWGASKALPPTLPSRADSSSASLLADECKLRFVTAT